MGGTGVADMGLGKGREELPPLCSTSTSPHRPSPYAGLRPTCIG